MNKYLLASLLVIFSTGLGVYAANAQSPTIPTSAADKQPGAELISYRKEMARRIRRTWFPPKSKENLPASFSMLLTEKGDIASLTTANDPADIVTVAARKAIEGSAPFRKLPATANLSTPIVIEFKNTDVLVDGLSYLKPLDPSAQSAVNAFQKSRAARNWNLKIADFSDKSYTDYALEHVKQSWKDVGFGAISSGTADIYINSKGTIVNCETVAGSTGNDLQVIGMFNLLWHKADPFKPLDSLGANNLRLSFSFHDKEVILTGATIVK